MKCNQSVAVTKIGVRFIICLAAVSTCRTLVICIRGLRQMLRTSSPVCWALMAKFGLCTCSDEKPKVQIYQQLNFKDFIMLSGC